MKRILFTHSYFLRYDPKQWATGQPYAPLGTLYAAALMRANGYDVSFFDTMFAQSPQAAVLPIMEHRPDFFVIYDDGFNYLTKMCLENMREAAFAMIKLAKSMGCVVIVASSDSTDRYELYLNEGADVVIMGEGEMTLLELINQWQEGRPQLAQISGLAFNEGGSILKTGRRELLKELDKLPLPAWDLVDIQPYRRMWLSHHGYFSMNMATTRGCPFKCNWCAKPIYGNRYHSRTPAHVVKELMMLQQQFGVEHIWFCDDIFGLKPGWIREFAELIANHKIVLRFKMQGRVDLLLEEDNIRDLARAGCENIWMGAESGSQRILDAMDKGTRVEQIYEATRLLKKWGIRPAFFIQFGYPSETREDIEKTITMINELLPFEIGISVSYPLPGTAFYEKVKADLVHKTNWKDSDELALMFRNTFQPRFYRRLHRYVHRNYRTHIAVEQLRQVFSRPGTVNLGLLRKVFSALYNLPALWIDRLRLQHLQKPVNG